MLLSLPRGPWRRSAILVRDIIHSGVLDYCPVSSTKVTFFRSNDELKILYAIALGAEARRISGGEA